MNFLISLLANKGRRQISQRPLKYESSRNIAYIEYHLFVKCADNISFLEDTYELLKSKCAEIYSVNVYDLPASEMHNTDSNGTFHYLKGNTIEEMQQYTKLSLIKSGTPGSKNNFKLEVLRIEINSEREIISKIGTLAHEIGHLLIHLRGEKQDESRADLYVKEVIQSLLTPFHSMLLSVLIKCYTGEFPISHDEIELFYVNYFALNPLRHKYSFDLV